MFRSTFLVIILAIFGFGIIFGLIGGVVGSMVEKQQSLETVESSSEADRVQEGVQQEVVNACDGCVEIPQYGTKHSLNVSVTTGIILWEFANKLMKFR